MKVGFDKLTHLGNTQIHEVCYGSGATSIRLCDYSFDRLQHIVLWLHTLKCK